MFILPKYSQLLKRKEKLKKRYLQLAEDAYNFRQTDHALSDFAEYRAMQLRNHIHRLTFLERDFKTSNS